MEKVIIDVRERDEFDAEHIPHSINAPLSEFNRVAPGLLRNLENKSILIMCRSGRRSELALQQIPTFGTFKFQGVEVYQGGILEWKKQGKDIVTTKKFHLSILRQVHLISGLLTLTGAVLAFTWDVRFAILPLITGTGLTFAGATGTCLMANILAVLPWNKSYPEVEEELRAANQGTTK